MNDYESRIKDRIEKLITEGLKNQGIDVVFEPDKPYYETLQFAAIGYKASVMAIIDDYIDRAIKDISIDPRTIMDIKSIMLEKGQVSINPEAAVSDKNMQENNDQPVNPRISKIMTARDIAFNNANIDVNKLLKGESLLVVFDDMKKAGKVSCKRVSEKEFKVDVKAAAISLEGKWFLNIGAGAGFSNIILPAASFEEMPMDYKTRLLKPADTIFKQASRIGFTDDMGYGLTEYVKEYVNDYFRQLEELNNAGRNKLISYITGFMDIVPAAPWKPHCDDLQKGLDELAKGDIYENSCIKGSDIVDYLKRENIWSITNRDKYDHKDWDMWYDLREKGLLNPNYDLEKGLLNDREGDDYER